MQGLKSRGVSNLHIMFNMSKYSQSKHTRGFVCVGASLANSTHTEIGCFCRILETKKPPNTATNPPVIALRFRNKLTCIRYVQIFIPSNLALHKFLLHFACLNFIVVTEQNLSHNKNCVCTYLKGTLQFFFINKPTRSA